MKVFSYLTPNETIADYHPSFIRVTLLAHAEYTVETLILEADGKEKHYTRNGYIGNLRKFKVPRKLASQYANLINCVDVLRSRLAVALPASIEEIHLDNQDYNSWLTPKVFPATKMF